MKMSKADHIVDRTIDEGARCDMSAAVATLLKMDIPGPLAESLTRMKEALSSNDWAKWGVITAMLWAHLNQINTLLNQANRGGEAVQRELANIARKIDAVITRLR